VGRAARGCELSRQPRDIVIPEAQALSRNHIVAFFQLLSSGLITAAKGLRVTAYNGFRRPAITVPYPFKELDIAPGWRGRHRVLRNDDGSPVCIACGACERICPDRCIRITRTKVTVTGPDGQEKQVNRPETFEIDLARCMYCNLCAEVCPVHCLHLTADYAYSCGDVRKMKVDLEGLLRPSPLSAYERAAEAAPEEQVPAR
jgi:formate hydrogenlyase subunit 6/NADH:ubiquinone oxidoreductase subunit I